ncbi:hypothetical protein NQ317_006223, partial [Molorchus minor]
ELKKLSEENLTRQPEEVFDIICKLGEGSYGSVYKALHKESGQVLAIKQVPVDTDLQEIIKEISIMQQCDSPYVVKYYGSYFKNTDLWIVMEYCGAGSVSDIMRLRKKTLTEDEIAAILSDTLKGLEYLHLRRKIHRDIKAGNILLNSEGYAKLADFGVAGQLTDTMAKRNTVIDFVSICLVKNPEERATATDLLNHVFIANAKAPNILAHMIHEAHEIRENQSYRNISSTANVPGLKQNITEESDDDVVLGNQTMVQCTDEGTLVPGKDGTLVPDSGTLVELESELGTMVINSDVDEQTMKRHDTGSAQGVKKYRPMFLDHFDKKEAELKQQGNGVLSPQTIEGPEMTVEEQQRFQSHYQLQLNQAQSPVPIQPQPQEHKPQYHRPFSDGEFEFVRIFFILTAVMAALPWQRGGLYFTNVADSKAASLIPMAILRVYGSQRQILDWNNNS